MLSHLINRSSTKARLEVGIKMALCRLKSKISFGVRNSSLKVGGDDEGSQRCEYLCPSICVGHLEHMQTIPMR